MKTVNLELSKALKEAGYPQESEFYWSIPEGQEKHAFVQHGKIPDENNELYRASGNKAFASPTADEILDLLPYSLDLNRKVERTRENPTGITGDWDSRNIYSWYLYPTTDDEKKYGVLYSNYEFPTKGIFHSEIDVTLADACAKMWLYLKKEGLL